MSISLLYHTQSVEGYAHTNYDFSGGELRQYINQKKNNHECSQCKSKNVTATDLKTYREIKALNMGTKNFRIMVRSYRNRCHDCGAYLMEKIGFCSSKTSRISKALERSIIELSPHLSIKALAEYFDLDWATVKTVLKKYLRKKYKYISLKNVKIIRKNIL